MSQVHVLCWAPPVSCSWDFTVECPKLGILALGFQWLLVNKVMPLAASLQLLSLWSSCGLISQQCELFREVRLRVGSGEGRLLAIVQQLCP